METIARRYASWAAVLGLLVAASPWIAWIGSGWGDLASALESLPEVPLGCLATVAAARAAAAHLVLSFARASRARAGFLGAAVAVGTMTIGTAAGSLPQFVGADWSTGLAEAAFAYVLRPVIFVSVFGLIPALFIGCTAGVLLGGALRKAPWSAGIPPAL